MKNKKLPIIIGITLALASAGINAQAADTKPQERQVTLAIASQSLRTALNEWAQQTGFQLVADVSGDFTAPTIEGTWTPQAALEQLLKGTPLTYEWVSERMVAIRVKPQTQTVSRMGGEQASRIHLAALAVPLAGAQVVAESAKPAEGEKQSGPNLTQLKPIQEVVVTGTHIRGAPSAGSRVLTMDREVIANSGYATVEGLMRTVPQNFNGGVGQGQAPTLEDGGSGNINQGTAVNLRGLGADSTLVLVDGRRQPPSGYSGSFVDISSIPTSAIERVEILPDGASALYGSDAVAGVVNFVLRKNFDGAESQLRFGGAEGGADQLQFSQIFGHDWSTGNVLVGYQYSDRGNLRRDKRPYTASNDLTPLGGSDYRVPFSNPANILDPATFQPAFAIPRGQDGTSLQAADLLPGVVNYDASSSATDLFGSNKTHSAFVNATQRLGDRSEVYASGRFSRRESTVVASSQSAFLFVPSSNPFFVDPFGGSDALFVTYNFSSDYGLPVNAGTVDTYLGTVGTTVELPSDWQVSLSGTYGREQTQKNIRNWADIQTGTLFSALADPDPATAFNPFGDGSHTSAETLSAIQTTWKDEADSTSRSANAILTGPLFRIGGARSMLAFGVDFRDQDTSSHTESAGVSQLYDWGRHVKAVFAEIALPLITSAPYPGLRDLSVSLAGRYEDYSDFGTTFNEKVGITWGATESVKVRGTWGTSFKAPLLSQLATSNSSAADGFVDLPSPSGPVNSLVRFGNNPDLKEETAEVWSVGLDWKPSAIPAFSTSLTFWNVDYEDRIARAGPTENPFGILFEADQWGSNINFNPTRAQVDAICRSPTFDTPQNPVAPEQCLTMMPSAIVDLRLTNLARVSVQGVDVEARYQFDTRAGVITVGLNGVYTSGYDRRVTVRSQEVDVSNTTGNVLRLRVRGEASWRRRGWDVGAFVNYANSYEDTFSVSGQSIEAWATVDATVSYQFEESKLAMGGLTVALHALNIFDRDPPFANVGYPNTVHGYDTTNADPFGRILTLQVSKVWGDAK